MAPEAIVKQARPTSDEAVRRLREESRRRIAERNRWRAFSSWCALATLASGISLTALSANDVRLREREAATQAAIVERTLLQEEDLAARRVAEGAVLRAKQEAAARAQLEAERDRIRAEAARALQRAAKRGKHSICGRSAGQPFARTPAEPLLSAPARRGS